jgi:hypothetical protein
LGTVSFWDLAVTTYGGDWNRAIVTGCCAPHGLSPIVYTESIGNGWAYEFLVNTPGTFVVELLMLGEIGQYGVRLTDLSTHTDPLWVLYDPINPDGLTDTLSAPLQAGRTYLAEIQPVVERDGAWVTIKETGSAYFVWRFEPVPEPGTGLLLVLGLAALGCWRARRRT